MFSKLSSVTFSPTVNSIANYYGSTTLLIGILESHVITALHILSTLLPNIFYLIKPSLVIKNLVNELDDLPYYTESL